MSSNSSTAFTITFAATGGLKHHSAMWRSFTSAEMLGSRGQVSLDHYEGRLKLVLGTDYYEIALDLLTEAAVHDGRLSNDAVARYRKYFRESDEPDRHVIEIVLNVLEHDGYLERSDSGYAFLSGLLQDWWRLRHGGSFVPIERRLGERDRET